MARKMSPCRGCSRVADPAACEDKSCLQWRRWFIDRWDAMRRQYPLQEHTDCDPCAACLCPRELCNVPCDRKQEWEERR